MTTSPSIIDLFKLLRPKQWTKNAFVLAPLFFSFNFLNPQAWSLTLLAVVCFICISGTIYIINDISDTEEDKAHPRKKLRPIASGKVPPSLALLVGLLLLALSALILVNYLPSQCIFVVAIYLIIQLSYSFSLKHYAIFDVLIIASGFVLRVLMGAYAIDVPVSPWIIITTFLLALFLGFGKRYHELSLKEYAKKRICLQRYNKPLLDRLIGISCASTLIFYSLYTVETARTLDNTALIYSVVFVIFGLFRYLQTLYVDNEGGEPERVLFKDPIFITNGVIWMIYTLSTLMI